MSNNDTRVIVDEVELSPEDLAFQDCEKVLRAGIWLIRNGYGQMQILPYLAPSGCYWRCEFHPTGKSQKAFYRYSTGSGGKYLQDHCGGSVRRSVSAKRLAQAIMVSVSQDMKDRCAGEVTHQTDEWLATLERALDQELIPQAFEDWGDYVDWKLVSLHGKPESSMRPQPGYIKPGTEPNWRLEPFWRSCAAQGETLRDEGAQIIDPSAIESAITEKIAAETYRAMLDADQYEPAQILELAVHAVLFEMQAKLKNRRPTEAFRDEER